MGNGGFGSLIRGLAAITAVALCALFRIWQTDISAGLQMELAESRVRIRETADQISLSQSRIAQASSPEYLSWLSSNLGLGLVKIDPDKNYFVEEEAYEQ